MTVGIQGHERQGNRGVGGLIVLVTTTFVGLVALLVSGQLSNLVLELLDSLKEDFYDS